MIFKTLSTDSKSGHDNDENQNDKSFADDFANRIFGESLEESPLYRKLEKIEKNRSWGMFSNIGDSFEDSMKEAATYFEFDRNEINQEDFSYRADMNFRTGMTYTPEDLNLRKPGSWRPSKKSEFHVTSDEVLKKADFGNVKFLANFLTDAGIIIKRSQTKISAKAQRKVATEIKIARAFGLLPFTTMGTKNFKVGTTMEALDADYSYQSDHLQESVEE
ncbi:uncharacterized protein LOC130827134 isoform X3 [Amaranthus tricolor]|nr:uncharacterized protein LOC130827134 isoform X3 [Amaranthus tricolor]